MLQPYEIRGWRIMAHGVGGGEHAAIGFSGRGYEDMK